MFRITTCNHNLDLLEKVNNILIDCHQNLNRQYTIILPDNYSLAFEKSIADKFGATINVDVLTFKRLFYKHFGVNIAALDKTNAKLIMASVLSSLKNELLVFENASNMLVSFADDMLTLVANIKSSGQNAQKLKAQTENLDGILKSKLLDIALILEKYEERKGSSLDEIDCLNLLYNHLLLNNIFENHTVIFAGFDVMTKESYNLILAIAQKADSCHYLESILDSEVFSEVYTYKTIEKQLESFGIPYISEQVFSTNENNFLFDKLIDYSKPNENKYNFFAGTAIDEVTFVLQNIKRQIYQGAKYSEIGVLVCNLDKYGDKLLSEFSQAGIPYFLDRKLILSKNMVARYIIDILEFFDNKKSIQNITKIVKNPFFIADRLEVEIFENYLLKYGLYSKTIYDKFDFCTKQDSQKMQIAEQIRLSLISLLANFEDLSIEKLIEFTDKLSTYDSVYSASKIGETDHQFTVQSLGKIRQILNSILNIFGNEIKVSNAKDILQSLFDSTKISLAVKIRNAVLCGSASTFLFENIKYLYIIGANEGSFPKLSEDLRILTDKEIKRLKRNNIEINPTVVHDNLREKLVIAKLFSSNISKYFLSYDLSSSEKSEAFAQLEKVYDGKYQTLSEIPYHTFDSLEQRSRFVLKNYFGDKIQSQEMHNTIASLIANDSHLESYIKQSKDTSIKHLATELFYANNTTSISAIEKYYKCPYAHFLTYGLRLQERELAEILPIDIGNFLHLFLKYYVERFDFESEYKSIIQQLYKKDEFLRLQKLENGELIMQKVEQEIDKIVRVIRFQFANSDFENLVCEGNFGGKNAKFPSIKLDKVELIGIIDRVDIAKNAIRIIDYKSGGTEFDIITDLYFGKKLQLTAYLYALAKVGYDIVGGYYMRLSDNFERDSVKFQDALKGITERNLEYIRMTDKQFDQTLESQILGIKLKKIEDLDKAKTLYSRQEMQSILEYAIKMCNKAVDSVLSGEIKAKSYDCKYCEFYSICQTSEEELPKFDGDSILEFICKRK